MRSIFDPRDQSGERGADKSPYETLHVGAVAPKGIPSAIVAKPNAAINKALKDPGPAKRITDRGNVIGAARRRSSVPSSPRSRRVWGKMVKERGINPNRSRR